MDASEINSGRLNAKEVIFPKENGKFIFPVADGRIKTPGGDQELRTSTLIRELPIRGESHVDFLGESDGSLLPPHDPFPGAGEAINDFWSMSGNSIYRYHFEPRVKLYSPREESFPVPLKIFDVCPALQRRDDTHPQASRNRGDPTKKQNKNKDNSLAPSNRLRDLPDWLEEFTENLEDKEVPALRDTPANTSQDSDSERSTKLVSRKHSIFTHFPKDRNFKVCLRTKSTKALCKKRHWRCGTSSRKEQQITRFSMKMVNLEITTDTQLWHKIWPPNGFTLIRVKLTLLRRRKGV